MHLTTTRFLNANRDMVFSKAEAKRIKKRQARAEKREREREQAAVAKANEVKTDVEAVYMEDAEADPRRKSNKPTPRVRLLSVGTMPLTTLPGCHHPRLQLDHGWQGPAVVCQPEVGSQEEVRWVAFQSE